VTVVRVLVLLLAALAAIPAADPAAGATAARAVAETELAAQRVRQLDERRVASARLQAATAAVVAARRELASASAALVAATAEHTHRQSEDDRAGRGVVLDLERLQRAAGVIPAASEDAAARLAAAETGLARRTARLADALRVRVADELVAGRSGAVSTVPVLRLGAARAVAHGPDADHRGVLVEDGGVGLVTGPALPGAADAVARPGSVGLAVFDPSGTWAVQRPWSLARWLAAGRLFIWPILAVGALGLGTALWRTWALRHGRIERDGAAALRACAAEPAALAQVLATHQSRLESGLWLVVMCAGIAPLLGLLGTVTGMIDLFGALGAGARAEGLGGGISEALVTTQAGMLVAVPLLVVHAVLTRMAERRLEHLDAIALERTPHA